MSRTKTLSSDFYHSSSVFNQETESIFKNEWLWVGRSDQLTTSGSYITTDLINYPIIVVRDNSNNLKAFHNVCRHRAAKVISNKEGVCKHMICPYHGWKYDLNGKLMDTPKFYANDDFEKDRHSLFEISVAERFGLIFINLNKESKPLDKWFGGFEKIVSNYFTDNLILHNELRFDVHANWKTYVDNYQEGYHIPLVHPQLNRDVVWQEYKLENKMNIVFTLCQIEQIAINLEALAGTFQILFSISMEEALFSKELSLSNPNGVGSSIIYFAHLMSTRRILKIKRENIN